MSDEVKQDTASRTIEVEPSTVAADEEIKKSVEINKEDVQTQVAKLVAEGKKAIALKQWEESVTKYADALELQGQLVGDFDPSMAPLLLSYGKAIYELALSQQGVMGKEEVAKGTDPTAGLDDSGKGVLYEDPASDDEEEEEEQGEAGNGEEENAVAESSTNVAESGPPNAELPGDAEDDGDEPEDDFNAAWEVLDVARTLYEREVASLPEGEGRTLRLQLADCYLALGDVSCENENFPQAVQDYTSAIEIQSVLLPAASRALASSRYQLGTVLEFTPSGRVEALRYVQAALDGFKLRADELSAAAEGRMDDVKCEDVAKLNEREREAERKEVESLLGDLEVKIDELKSAPVTDDIVSEGINHLLGRPSGAEPVAVDDRPVNDLNSMVRKKVPKKVAPAPPTNSDGKRKAEEDFVGSDEKKARVEDA